eukprot:TRINITY_DN24507_c0_g1_i2.p1 TRINITY_DN24507_c0_g1~~TRINITY_DN24507_c0_g1_i2.p1  ORF type:complete len:235 (+),score=44.51 TRINITY_DN24507_c0_g1_i2:63-767(+)
MGNAGFCSTGSTEHPVNEQLPFEEATVAAVIRNLPCGGATKDAAYVLGCGSYQTLQWSEKTMMNCRLLQGAVDGDVAKVKQALADGASVDACRWPSLHPQATEEPYAGVEEVVMDSDVNRPRSPGRSEDTERIEDPKRLPSMSALMYAAREGHTIALNVLLTARADVSLKESDGMQPLHFAAAAACSNCVKLLMDVRADPEAKDDFDRTPFQCLPKTAVFNMAEERKWKALLLP